MPPDNRIRLVQCKCAANHCIMAVAFDPRNTADEEAETQLAATVGFLKSTGHLNPWCSLCRSQEWHYEIGTTRFYSMTEAMPYLEAYERRQAHTRELLQAAEN